MRHIDFVNKNVFDFGTGTGILAILGSRLGAASITAIDNDEWSIRNAEENFQKNNIHSVNLYVSSVTPENKFDIVLANINRNVLEQYSSALVNILSAKGILLVSGILEEDEKFIVDVFKNLRVANIQQKQNWLSILFAS
jgi:ribosomal protein L11 methyltransferase